MLLPPSTLAAAQIDAINRETDSYDRAQMRRVYDLLTSTGNPQEVLDQFGSAAADALRKYTLRYGMLEQIGQAGDLVPPVFEIYQPQPDGTVLYVPPPAPEPEPELEQPAEEPPAEEPAPE